MTLLDQRINAWRPEGITLESEALKVAKHMANSLVVAGPGAGKTELLAQRACFLLQTGVCPSPYRILAISFKRDAAENLKSRVVLRCGRELASRLDSMTFDAFAKDILDRFRLALPKSMQPSADYEIVLGKDALDDGLYQRFLGLSNAQCSLTVAERRSISGSNLVKDGMLSRPLPYECWPKSLNVNGGIDLWKALIGCQPSQLTFPMIGRLAELIVRSNPSILTALRHTYKFVFLDEFQDTTTIQFQLTQACFRESSSILTAVGDTKQRIMGWAGALPGVFRKFEETFGGRRFKLKQNHRSRSRLVEIQSVFARELDSESVVAEVPTFSTTKGECRVIEYTDENQEAEHISELIRQIIASEKVPADEICVLCRTRPESFASALILKLKEKGVPARVDVGIREVVSEPAVAFILAVLSLILGDSEPEAWEHVNAIITDVSGDKHDQLEIERMRALVDFIQEMKSRVASATDESGVNRILNACLDFVGKDRFKMLYPQYAQGDYLDEVVDRLTQIITSELALSGWTKIVNAVRGVGAVPVMTMHKSKGLEFHTVVFLGLEDAALWNYQKNAEEETCGLFVALSRAKERCIFTFSRSRPGKYQSPVVQSRDAIQRLFQIFSMAGVNVEKVD